MQRWFLALTLTTGLASEAYGQSPSTGSGQAFPTRPVRVGVPQPAHGSMDANARALAIHLEQVFSHNFVIDKRGGANAKMRDQLI